MKNENSTMDFLMFSTDDGSRSDADLPEHYHTNNFNYQYFDKEEYWYSDSNFFEDPFDVHQDREIDSNDEYVEDNYSILGLKRSASQEDIKAAFRTAALASHPDKPGGSNEAFQKVRDAYEKIIN